MRLRAQQARLHHATNFPFFLICVFTWVTSCSGKQNPLANLRVVVMNDVVGHYEVLAGVLHVLENMNITPHTLFMGSPSVLHSTGWLDWMNAPDSIPSTPTQVRARAKQTKEFGFQTPKGPFHYVALGHPKDLRLPSSIKAADVVICTSPEMSRGECGVLVKRLKPRLLIAMVHRGSRVTLGVTQLWPRMSLVALAPHVAAACHNYTHQETEWFLPIAPHTAAGSPLQATCTSLACLDGFTTQGAIRRTRGVLQAGYSRNYSHLMDRMDQFKSSGAPSLRLRVLGKGNTTLLGIPQTLRSDIKHFKDFPYPRFWGRIHRSLALIPCFGLEVYITSRLSSTIIASLITSTPIIADQATLNAYSFLTEEHVFLRKPDEDEVQAMYRIQNMSEEEVFKRRRALVRLRDQLNKESSEKLTTWIMQAMSRRR